MPYVGCALTWKSCNVKIIYMAQVSVRFSADYLKHKDYSFVGCDAE